MTISRLTGADCWIPAVAFSGAKHEKEHTDIYSCRLDSAENGAEIYNRTALDNTLIYSGVIVICLPVTVT